MSHEGSTDTSPEKDTPQTEISEETKRNLAFASFTDTQYALGKDWAPARNRDDAPRNTQTHPAYTSDRLRDLRT